jgi:hypothetical protein
MSFVPNVAPYRALTVHKALQTRQNLIGGAQKVCGVLMYWREWPDPISVCDRFA